MNYKQKTFSGINSFSNLDGKAGLASVPDNFVDLVLTDPPYNVDVEETAGKIKNDNMADAAFYDFLIASFQNMEDCCEKPCYSS